MLGLFYSQLILFFFFLHTVFIALTLDIPIHAFFFFVAEHYGHFLFPPPSSAGRGPNEKGAGGVTEI